MGVVTSLPPSNQLPSIRNSTSISHMISFFVVFLFIRILAWNFIISHLYYHTCFPSGNDDPNFSFLNNTVKLICWNYSFVSFPWSKAPSSCPLISKIDSQFFISVFKVLTIYIICFFCCLVSMLSCICPMPEPNWLFKSYVCLFLCSSLLKQALLIHYCLPKHGSNAFIEPCHMSLIYPMITLIETGWGELHFPLSLLFMFLFSAAF